MVNLELLPAKGDILLLVPPVVWTALPMVGVHVVQAAVRKAHIKCSILYTNLLYSQLLGTPLHTAIALEDYAFMKERLFTAETFDLPSLGYNFHRYFRNDWLPDHIWPKKYELPNQLEFGLFSPFIEQYKGTNWKHLEQKTGEWLQILTKHIAQLDYRIIGATTTHGGLTPAIALLKAIKANNPNTITLLGGTWCEGDLAEGILSIETDIDYIFSGEAEKTFPIFAGKLLNQERPKERIIKGEQITDMNMSPLPCYNDYFQQQKQFQKSTQTIPKDYIPYEISRGCSYARCTFCGQKGMKRSIRHKTTEHCVKEIHHLINETSANNIYFTDNTIDTNTIIPILSKLTQTNPRLRFLFQTRADISFNHLLKMQNMGISFIQPGIETLSDSILQKIEKGVTLEEVITLLRMSRILNIDLKWNLLFGFPGEDDDELKEIIELIPLLCHLQPPQRMIPLKLCRFSRYWNNPKKFDIDNFRPAEIYKEIFPKHSNFEKLATFFAGEFEAASFKNPQLINQLFSEYKKWYNSWTTVSFLPIDLLAPSLHMERKSKSEFLLKDSRGIPWLPKDYQLNTITAKQLLYTTSVDIDRIADELKWALKSRLGILVNSRFIPFVTTSPELYHELSS